MLLHIAGGGAACVIGGLIGLFNYRISRKILLTDPDKYAAGTVVRQLLNIGWLLVCFFVGEHTALSTTALLVGAVLGVTVPSFYFTWRLLKANREAGTGRTKKPEKEEGNADG